MTLSLAEQILLLHLDERSGRLQGTYTPLLVVAAEVAELALRGRVLVNEDGVRGLNASPTDDPGWNALLQRLQTTAHELRLPKVSEGQDRQRLIRAVAGRLVSRGIWASDVERVFFSTRTIYATIEPEFAEQVKYDIQNTLESHQPAEERRVVLLALLKGARRLDTVLSKQEKRFFDERIRSLISGLPLAFALSHQIEKVIASDEAAAAAAVIVATSG